MADMYDNGGWGSWDTCSTGSYAAGIQLRVSTFLLKGAQDIYHEPYYICSSCIISIHKIFFLPQITGELHIFIFSSIKRITDRNVYALGGQSKKASTKCDHILTTWWHTFKF